MRRRSPVHLDFDPAVLGVRDAAGQPAAASSQERPCRTSYSTWFDNEQGTVDDAAGVLQGLLPGRPLCYRSRRRHRNEEGLLYVIDEQNR